MSHKIVQGAHFFLGVTLWGLLAVSTAPAATLDYFGPPLAGDPSAFTGPIVGLDFAGDFLATLPEANEGSYEGGVTGTSRDTGANNSVPEDQLL